MILIALGANTPGHMGSPLQTIRWAIGEMTKVQLSVMSISSFYRTKAVGQQGQADYINGVVRVHAMMSAPNILKNLKRIENRAGRERYQNGTSKHWGPRPLDLDIVDYKGAISRNFQSCNSDYRETKKMKIRQCHLVLPHPRAHLRPFVIRPILDIHPFWHHPVSGQSACSLWTRLRQSDEGRVLERVE